MNKRTILNIQEIASLKSGRKTLEEIRKTHDGTSMGKLPIGEFVSKYGGDHYYHEVVYDKDGNIIDNIEAMSIGSWYKTNGEDRTDTHVIFSIDAYEKEGFYHELDDGTAWLTQPDLNDFGLNTYRSITSVGGNGSSMSVIRNNKFSSEDAEKLKNIHKEFDIAVENYYTTKGANPTMDMDEFIKKNGWDKKFEECNVKIRFQKNSKYANYEYDRDENLKIWEEEYPDYIENGGEPLLGEDYYPDDDYGYDYEPDPDYGYDVSVGN